jgi:2-iminobutanoate/2-iminopropanoate deaminase
MNTSILSRLPLPLLPLVVLALGVWAPEARAGDSVPVEHSNAGSPLAGDFPFSAAVRVGDLLILSGQIGNLPGTTTLAPGGIKAEAKQVLENIKGILEANGSSMDRVVKCTAMIADIDEWADFNEVYVTYFPGPKPARSAFEAAGLAFDARVELECWAAN